ncbi:MAG: hypothetical protein ABIR70_05085 [Bryobacteraceae bacterium]
MVRNIVKLTALLSLLSGCGRPPQEQAPAGPGVSAQLSFPVLLVGQHRLVVKNDELNLTNTTVASGLNFPEFTLIDSNGVKYSITKVTDFGRPSTFFDMGTTQFRVFLQLKSGGSIGLTQARGLLTATVDSLASTQEIQKARTIHELIEACRKI